MASDDLDRGWRDVVMFREEGDESSVGFAAFRGGGDLDFEGAIGELAGDGSGGGAGGDFDAESDGMGRFHWSACVILAS